MFGCDPKLLCIVIDSKYYRSDLKAESVYKLLLDRDLREAENNRVWSIAVVSADTDLKWLPYLREQDPNAFENFSIVKIYPQPANEDSDVLKDYDTVENAE